MKRWEADPEDARPAPILVTGAPRSGTTWVGGMLALAPSVGYVHEPFNPLTPAGISGGGFHRFFHYVCEENEASFAPALRRTLAFSYDLSAQLPTVRSPRDVARTGRDLTLFTVKRLRQLRPLVKDPIAVFSAEWLADRLGMDVVVCVRHPAAVVASFKRLGWTHRFRSFLEEPELMRDHLAPFEAEIRAYAEHERDVVSQATLLWRLVHHVLATFRERRPAWSFVRHEDLSLDPGTGFEALYRRLRLRSTARTRRTIERYTSAANPAELRHRHDVRLDSRASLGSWKRVLTAAEIEQVREGVGDVASAFYRDDEW